MWRYGLSHPWLLSLMAVPLLMSWLPRIAALRRRGAVPLPSYDWLSSSATGSEFPRRFPVFLRAFSLAALVVVAAGAGGVRTAPLRERRPDALVILLDNSSSMTAQDFAPESRLVAAKQVLEEFVTSSPGFELGLIQVAAFPKLMVPVTAERASVLKALQTVNSAGFGEDGTAIGSGIASAANRLRGAAWNRRRILLLTDGVNNRGSISPVDAARLAAGMGIRIDAVGLGTDRVSRYWVPASEQSSVEVEARIEIDDKALAEVAGITGGAYRKVADSAELRRVLLDLASELRQPSEPPGAERRVSLPQALSACALLLLCVEFAWRRFLFSELPG